MAEELGLQQVGRQGSTIHLHEGLVPALAAEVGGPRHQLLAGAGLANDEHRRQGFPGLDAGDTPYPLAQLAHHRAVTHQRLELPGVPLPRLEIAQAAALALALGEQADALAQLAQGHRLGEQVVGPGLHGVHGQLDAAVTGDHQDGHLRVEPADAPDHHQPVHIGQAVIQHHQIRAEGRTGLQPIGGRQGHPHAVPPLLQELGGVAGKGFFVVDDQDVRHGSGPGKKESHRRAALGPAVHAD